MFNHLIVCPQCDVLIDKPTLNEGQKAICSRCGGKLADKKINTINRTLAVSLAGLICFFPAILFPMIGIGAFGLLNKASLLETIILLINKDFYIIAGAVFIFTIAVPLVQLTIAFYLALTIKRNQVSPLGIPLFRSFHLLKTWAMLHVFFLGLIVSMYKLLSLAELTIDIGFAAFIAFLILATYCMLSLDRELVWNKLEQLK
ncbi:MAG: paraquat-inducible protein A [Thalassotalea sp.]